MNSKDIAIRDSIVFAEIPKELPRVMHVLNEQLGLIKHARPSLLPDFSRSSNVFCISDYSGEDGKSIYQVLGFLITDDVANENWTKTRQELRKARWRDGSTMQYKSLSKDKIRMSVLPEFLDASNSLKGVSITFLIHKNVRWLFGRDDGLPGQFLESIGYAGWKDRIAEKMLRVLHFQALLLAGLTHSRQRTLWHTDRDSITEGNKESQIASIYGRVLQIYMKEPRQLMGVSQRFDNDPHFNFGDLLSLPDLICGALLAYHEETEEGQQLTPGTETKAGKILHWFASNEHPLKRFVFRIHGETLNFGMQRLEFSRNPQAPNP